MTRACAPAITRRREESVVAAGGGMRMRAVQIGDAIIGAMPVIPAWRLIVVQARIVVDSVVLPPLLRGFTLGFSRVLLGLPVPLGI